MAKSSAKRSGKAIPKVEFDLVVSAKQRKELLDSLMQRFESNMKRHGGIEWSKVQAKLEAHPDKLSSLHAMESTSGEPDVVGIDGDKGEYLFFDCSKESPDRRSICYDADGENERTKKGIFPRGNALDLAAGMGIEILTEDQYRKLQTLGEFDTKTSSWIRTAPDIRELGGALFCDRRYNTVFLYHNGAQSFYSSRGFRGSLRV